MRLLFYNARFPDNTTGFLSVEKGRIAYIGSSRPAGSFSREIDCEGNLLMSGLFNLHCHAAMTLFRGYGEDLPLQRWLHERIFPAEDRLSSEKVRAATALAVAEMLRGGIVSFSDMYFFCEDSAEVILSSGIKANLSRSLVSFTEGQRAKGDPRFEEAVALYRAYHNAGNGRLKIDMSLHAEYSNVESYIRDVADYTAAQGLILETHLSETKEEHDDCVARRGMTPAAFFEKCGLFASPVVCAHGVWLTADDRALLAARGATVVHNPCSNLKLGSGVAPLALLTSAGINVALGTDGAASNNTLDLFREMYVASLLSKGISRDPTQAPAAALLAMATVNGARAQGREGCGELRAGSAADLILVDLDSLNNIPSYDPLYTLLYSASSRDVLMTVVDGEILYEKGVFYTLDIEKIKEEFKRVCDY